MAQAAQKVDAALEFVMEYTKVWLHLEGRRSPDKKSWIQPPLNDAGRVEFEKYLLEDLKAVEFPVYIGFPVPKGGFEQYLPKAIRDAWQAKWTERVLTRFSKMELRLDADFVGNTRIRINRLATPIAYAKYCQPFPQGGERTPGVKSAEKPSGFTEV